DCCEMFRFFGFQIQIKSNQRPVSAVSVAKSVFDDGANPLEEVFAHFGFGSRSRSPVTQERSHLAGARIPGPQQVLLDRKRNSRWKPTLQAPRGPRRIFFLNRRMNLWLGS